MKSDVDWSVIFIICCMLLCCGDPDVLDGLAKRANNIECKDK